MKKNVCMIVCHDFSPPHSRTYDEMQILAENGYDVTLLALSRKGLPKEEILRYGKVIRIYRSGICYPRFPIINNPIVVLIFFCKALRLNADIYHCYDMYDILLGTLLKVAGKKVIYDIGDDEPSNQAGYIYRRLLKSKKLRVFLEWAIRFAEAILCKFYDCVITLTDSLKNDRLKYTKKIKTIYYCPNASFNPANNESIIQNRRKNCHIIVYEGSISDKGLDVMLESLSMVLKTIDNVKLLIIGDISKVLNKEIEIEQYIKKNDFYNHVETTGWIPYTEVPKYINAGDIGLAVLRPWSYSFKISVPNKLIEYMACGKPVIASKGFTEVERIVNDAKCGILVDYDNPKQVADAIIYLLKNDKERIEIGENGRKFVEKYHNPNILKDELLSVYSQVLR